MTSPGERGILVDQNMRSISDKNIYAAGDCCTVYNWPAEETPNWFQARPEIKFDVFCIKTDIVRLSNFVPKWILSQNRFRTKTVFV